MMIRKATAADLDGVAAVYEAVLDREEQTGCHWTNWQSGVYPCRATAERALADGTLYVDEVNGHILGCANLNHVQPPEYGSISWTIQAKPKQVLVIHTLCIRPECAGRCLLSQIGLPAGRIGGVHFRRLCPGEPDLF